VLQLLQYYAVARQSTWLLSPFRHPPPRWGVLGVTNVHEEEGTGIVKENNVAIRRHTAFASFYLLISQSILGPSAAMLSPFKREDPKPLTTGWGLERGFVSVCAFVCILCVYTYLYL
jgi:hypothetical protein